MFVRVMKPAYAQGYGAVSAALREENAMYSPKIDERLIPVLYHLGRARKKPMTELVTDLIGKALVREDLPEPAMEALSAFVARPETSNAA